MKSLLLDLVALFLCASAQAQGYGKTIYISPDGKFRAEIVPTYTQERGFHEHCVTIYTRTGKQLAQNDHSSNDHEHGQTVNQAEWTPDSRFFVYSTHSSGGHSGWHFPTYVYVGSLERFVFLDEYIGPSTTPLFIIYPPNHFSGRRLNPARKDTDVDIGVPVDVNLSNPQWRKHP
jgi:hypothetical protein